MHIIRPVKALSAYKELSTYLGKHNPFTISERASGGGCSQRGSTFVGPCCLGIVHELLDSFLCILWGHDRQLANIWIIDFAMAIVLRCVQGQAL